MYICLLSPCHKGALRDGDVLLFVCLFVCRLERVGRCPMCFFHREKLSPGEINAGGGGLLVVAINALHLSKDANYINYQCA